MSKPTRRKCPQCGEVKTFRADCKTCGCPRPVRTVDSAPTVPDPLVGKWFLGAGDKPMIGKIESRVGPMYLVHRQDDPFDELCLVPLANMAGWRLGDKKWLEQYVTYVLDEVETAEVEKTLAVPTTSASIESRTTNETQCCFALDNFAEVKSVAVLGMKSGETMPLKIL